MKTNKPMPFDLGLITGIRVNPAAIKRRVDDLASRRTFKQDSQAAALIRAIQCLDLTTLSGDDTFGRVDRLCAKAKTPVSSLVLKELGLDNYPVAVGAVCVYHAMVAEAVRCLAKSKIPVAAVATGFPAGQIDFDLKLSEIKRSIQDGATEIDVVLHRTLALEGNWQRLYDQLVSFREACGEKARLKTILGVGDLKTLELIAKASAVAIMAGADFIKTSTGFEKTNASFEAGLVMARQIRYFNEFHPHPRVGLKPAGGIQTSSQALRWLILMLEELGEDWTKPELFRIGASTLLTDLEMQLYHQATGRYPAAHHQAEG